ncbi:MAG: aldehyde dehydrogenase family protein [Anaerolineae bacterium]|nr:aldehyde dehydrogenase family protein [Anaerolineae bacterium]
MIREMNPIHLNALMDYVDGQSVTPLVKLSASVSNPNMNEPLQQQRATSDAFLEQALAAAARVHHTGAWRSIPFEDRALLLEQIADDLDEHLEDLALIEALTTGTVIRQARALVRLVPLAFRQAAKQSRFASKPLALSNQVTVERIPWGPVALITPWSASSISVAQKVASALAAGCPVILKPSEWAPHTSGILADVIARHDLPTGTFQLVHGSSEVGMKLISDARIKAVSMTGGQGAGRAVALACAAHMKPVQLELGGLNQMIVLEDADLDAAAEGVVSALITLNGQWCRGMSRLLVHRSRYTALLMRVLERLEAVTIGDSLSPDSDMGPLIHAAHLQQVLGQRDRLMAAGGIVHEPTRMPDMPGYFMEPALITNCQPADTLDEIFGPVATVHMFKDDAEAIKLVNRAESGVICYLYAEDEARARAVAQALEVTNVAINGVSLLGLHPQAPRTSWGSSGLGESGTIETLRFFTGGRAIGIAGG